MGRHLFVIVGAVIVIVIAIVALLATNYYPAPSPGGGAGVYGGDEYGGGAPQQEATPAKSPERTVEIRLRDFSISPGTIRVSRGETVRFVVINEGNARHNFVIPALGVTIPSRGLLGNGDSAEAIVTIDLEPGEYEVYCGPHRDIGMVATLVVE